MRDVGRLLRKSVIPFPISTEGVGKSPLQTFPSAGNSTGFTKFKDFLFDTRVVELPSPPEIDTFPLKDNPVPAVSELPFFIGELINKAAPISLKAISFGNSSVNLLKSIGSAPAAGKEPTNGSVAVSFKVIDFQSAIILASPLNE